jgi:hypothetical protein
MGSKLPEVTLQSQREHVKKIKSLLDVLARKESYTLNEGEISTVARALACHMFVIELDLKRQEDEQNSRNQKTEIN